MTARRFTSEHPIFSVTADLVVLTMQGGVFSVLLVRRGGKPYAGRLALPGGFVQEREDIEDAAYRELEEEAGVGPEDVVLEQLRTYGAPGRDPRGRVVTVAWLAMGANLPDPRAGSDAAEAIWVPVEEALGGGEPLAFDHDQILRDGVERARAKLEYSGLAAAFCASEFTVAELRSVYEAVWGRRLDKANFHRKVTGADGFLRPTGEYTRSGRGRPARLFVADPASMLRPPIMRVEASD
jgi:8-oxo-dGTP diphosphatase